MPVRQGRASRSSYLADQGRIGRMHENDLVAQMGRRHAFAMMDQRRPAFRINVLNYDFSCCRIRLDLRLWTRMPPGCPGTPAHAS